MFCSEFANSVAFLKWHLNEPETAFKIWKNLNESSKESSAMYDSSFGGIDQNENRPKSSAYPDQVLHVKTT